MRASCSACSRLAAIELKARTVGRISLSRVSGIRAVRSPWPSRVALSASARTGRRPMTRIMWVSPRRVTRSTPVTAIMVRTSIHSSFSRLSTDGVTASTP